MSVFPVPMPGTHQGDGRSNQDLSERLQEAERRCAAAERELGRVIRESMAEAHNAASAIARLSSELDRERARAKELERLMGAIGHEFAILNATATTLAERAGVNSAELLELKQMWSRASADPDHAAVGLDGSAPDFLIKAARTAYRREYHPDTKPASEKATAEAAFKRNEATFDKLFRARGLSR